MGLMDDIFASGDRGRQFVAGLMARMANSPADPDGAMAQADVPSGDLLAHVGGGLMRKGADTIQSAVTAPRDAYTGDLQVFDPATGHVSDDAMRRANEMAGLAMTGSMPFEAPAGALRMFGGRNAATADHAALAQAQKLAETGADRKAIWDQTGWFKGADDKWRFEIPDDASKMTPKAAETLTGAGVGVTNSDAAARTLMHRDMYAAYPDMRQMPVDVTKGGGYPFQPSGEYRTFASGRDAIGVNAANPDQVRDLTLHELQHGIQKREGFAAGANPDRAGAPRDEQFASARRAYEASADDNAILRELGIDVPDVAQKPWEQLTARQQLEWLSRGRGHDYHRSAGEVEARNVQTRRDMTPEQRRATPPWETQDVPDAQQIVRMLGR